MFEVRFRRRGQRERLRRPAHLDDEPLEAARGADEGIPEIPPEWLATEYYEDDVNKMAEVARSERGISTLHEATGGDVTRSAHYHAAMKQSGASRR